MKHHIKLRHPGRYETDCGKMIRDKNEVTSSRMDTDCPHCLIKIQESQAASKPKRNIHNERQIK